MSSSPEGSRGSKLFPIFQKNFKPAVTAPIEGKENDRAGKRRKIATKLAKDPEGLSQMVLDAGQSQLGPRICDECGLLYSPGDYEDEMEHRKEHERLNGAFELKLWKSAEILFNYVESSHQIVLFHQDHGGRKGRNKPTPRLKDFLAWLDSELGAGFAPTDTESKGVRVFLYVGRTKRKGLVRILGAAITEIPDHARINCYSVTNGESFPHSCLKVGLTRLWVDPGCRKKGIAGRLCEMIRFHSGMMGVIEKEALGILEPTEEGRAFMTKWTQGKGLAYSYIPSDSVGVHEEEDDDDLS